jgi:hypothetical protein
VTASVIDALEQALRRARGRRAAPSVLDAILEVSQHCAALPIPKTSRGPRVGRRARTRAPKYENLARAHPWSPIHVPTSGVNS